MIDKNRSQIKGKIKLKLYKGNITIVSRISNSRLYSLKKVSFEENKTFNKKNVENFIKKHCKLLRK
jgi:argininosuccinate synthase